MINMPEAVIMIKPWLEVPSALKTGNPRLKLSYLPNIVQYGFDLHMINGEAYSNTTHLEPKQ
jgi:hypothetical protein